MLFEKISSLANTRYWVMPLCADIVVGSKPPIRDSIWLMEPVEDNSSANRFMIVEIAPMLLRPSSRSDNII